MSVKGITHQEDPNPLTNQQKTSYLAIWSILWSCKPVWAQAQVGQKRGQAGLANPKPRMPPLNPTLAWNLPKLEGVRPKSRLAKPKQVCHPRQSWPHWSKPGRAPSLPPALWWAQSLGLGKPDLGWCRIPVPARPTKSSRIGTRPHGSRACAQTGLQDHTSWSLFHNLLVEIPGIHSYLTQ
jgi:hypothetical protein